ncbi:MAG TPA: FG-GAP-like repeat-containing protein [Candidatus Acidoferrales bacterium]|nr:FG-GAP-like repeat-containing protein [Candidatus Acidoferrales bacterium]
MHVKAPIGLVICALLGAALAEGQSSVNTVPAQVSKQESAQTGSDKQTSGTTAQKAHSQVQNPKLAREAFQRGLKTEKAKDWDSAFAAYTEATRQDPANQEYLLRREIARSRLVGEAVDRAERDALMGNLAEARKELRMALILDPSDTMVRERLTQLSPSSANSLRQLMIEPAGVVRLAPFRGVLNFDYRGDTQGAYEEVAQRFGVDASFDGGLRQIQVHLQLNNVDFYTAMRALGDMTGTFWRPLTQRLFFVAEDTPAKRREYDLSVVRTVQLPDDETPNDMTEVLRVLREIAGITRAQLNLASHTITMHASPQATSVAAQLLDQLEQAHGQLVIEMEILEVDRTTATQFGVTPPTTAQAFALTPQEIQEAQAGGSSLISAIEQVFGSSSALGALSTGQISSLVGSGAVGLGSLIPPLVAFGGGKTTFLATLPGAAAAFSDTLSTVKSGQRIVLRAEDDQPVSFFVGDRVPITLAQYSSSVVPSGLVPGVSSNMFPESTIATGNDPVAVVTADFNGDGNLDMAVANFKDNTVSIYLGNGDGTFSSNGTLATGNGPITLATADFNGDGFVDLAVLNETDNTVSIFLGNGDGTFALKGTYATGANPVAMVTGDFNNDGHTDLAVANQNDSTVSILLGNGDGTFQPQSTFATGKTPSAITTADFSNNGNLDLAVTNQAANTLSTFMGNGNGTFTANGILTTGNAPVAVVSGEFDLNNNTNIDLVVLNQTDNTISVYLGAGDGTFTLTTTFGLNDASSSGNKPVAITTGDFNVDGLTDLAVTDEDANTVGVFIGNGDGTFQLPLLFATGTSPVGLTAGTFEGTAHAPGLAIADSGANTLTIILDNATFGSTGPGAAPIPYPNSQYQDIGLKVKATPHMHAGGEVTLDMQFESTSLTGTTVNQIPIIGNESVSQTITAKDGQTTALAGIIESSVMRAISGTPGAELLGPLGLSASAQNDQNQSTELLILVTPRLIQPPPRMGKPIFAGREPVEGGSAPVPAQPQ